MIHKEAVIPKERVLHSPDVEPIRKRQKSRSAGYRSLSSAVKQYPATLEMLEQLNLIDGTLADHALTWEYEKILEHPMHK